MKLEAYIFPNHLEYLELSFTLGEDRAMVRTKKPLDADALISVSYKISLSARSLCAAHLLHELLYVSCISSSSWQQKD